MDIEPVHLARIYPADLQRFFQTAGTPPGRLTDHDLENERLAIRRSHKTSVR